MTDRIESRYFRTTMLQEKVHVLDRKDRILSAVHQEKWRRGTINHALGKQRQPWTELDPFLEAVATERARSSKGCATTL